MQIYGRLFETHLFGERAEAEADADSNPNLVLTEDASAPADERYQVGFSSDFIDITVANIFHMG